MKSPQEIINDSGYPLQIRLEEEIINPPIRHDWRILTREHRWFNEETNEEGYIDLVLGHGRYNLRLVIECKRIIGSWTFLLPNKDNYVVSDNRALLADFDNKRFLWQNSSVYPQSFESLFCVPEVDGKKDSRTLEKIAGELLLSAESLAVEEMDIHVANQRKGEVLYRNSFMYLPVIVTTAKLQSCVFDPRDINIEDGYINSSTLEDIKFIRFTKNLATNIEYSKPNIVYLGDANRENNRTVFVVQAKNFIEFITNIVV